jgi:hypothetical protein
VVVLTLRRCIDAMLRCRSVQVEIRGSNVRVLVSRRCPQEGVLSPLLWNVDVDYLLCRLHYAHYQTQGYADDVVLLQKDKFVNALCDRMQVRRELVQRDKNGSVHEQQKDLGFL